METPRGISSSSAAPQSPCPCRLGSTRITPGCCDLLFSKNCFPPGRAGPQLDSSCRSARICPRGLQGWSCCLPRDGVGVGEPGTLRSLWRAAPVTCWPLARAGRKTRGEFVLQSCARSACDAFSVRPCAAQTPLGAPSVLPQGPRASSHCGKAAIPMIRKAGISDVCCAHCRGNGNAGGGGEGDAHEESCPSSALVWQDHSPVRSTGRILEAEE